MKSKEFAFGVLTVAVETVMVGTVAIATAGLLCLKAGQMTREAAEQAAEAAGSVIYRLCFGRPAEVKAPCSGRGAEPQGVLPNPWETVTVELVEEPAPQAEGEDGGSGSRPTLLLPCWEAMTAAQLKEVAKVFRIRGYSRMRKAELVAALRRRFG